MNLVRAAAALEPDVAVIGIVRAAGDDRNTYLVQLPGVGRDVVCKAVEGPYAYLDPVVVLLEPDAHTPFILGISPWMVMPPSAVVSPISLLWADIVDADAACSSSPDVAANTAARHDRGHSLLSVPDHDAGGDPRDGDYVGYLASSSEWRPRSPGGLRWGDLYLLMGL